MQSARITPKDFFLWVGAMIALYASVFAFVSLVFDYLNYLLPDKLSYYTGDPYSSGIANEMAMLVVLFPLALTLMRMIRRSIAEDVSRAEIWVRRWALYLTLTISIAAMAGGIITLLVYFFQGDVTLRFVLKVATVLVVAIAAFAAFRADLRGYWDANPRHAHIARWSAFVLMFASIVAGFFIVGTPWQARLYRFDDQKVSDLQNIQYQVVNYWQAKEKLPKALADLQDTISGFVVPVDPQTDDQYEYHAKAPLTFELCATFNAETQPYSAITNSMRTSPVAAPVPTNMVIEAKGVDLGALPWTHTAGRHCFERTIDPDRYPPFSKTKTL